MELIKEINKLKEIENIYGIFKIQKGYLGEGGTSIVKEAEFENKKYAIKFFTKNTFNKDNIKVETTAFKRFKQAHFNLLSVVHSGAILPQLHFDIYDTGDIKIPYVIMPKADFTLEQWRNENNITFEDFEKIFKNLLICIETIHKFGIIHRDIKPSNIFMLNKKYVIGDFDISKFDENIYCNLVKTEKGDRLANYHFSAPEQSNKDGKVDSGSDWYAFGQVLYWLITKKTLRGQKDIKFDVYDIRYKKYESLVSKLLSEDQDDRFYSAEEIVDFLKSKEKLSAEQILFQFEGIIAKYTCKHAQSQFAFEQYNKHADIQEIMDDISGVVDKFHLWWSQGYSDIEIDKIKQLDKQEQIWLVHFDEIKIKSIWVFRYPYSLGCSLFVIETEALKLVGVYPDAYSWEVEQYAVYNGSKITAEEASAGWAEIDGKRVEVHGAEYRIRHLKNDIYFIAPQYCGPLIRHDDIIDKIYQQYKILQNVDKKLLEPLKNIKKPERL